MQKREHEWIEKIRNGDERAFKKMFQAYYPKLCRFAAEYINSKNRARDVVQEVFLQIWDQRKQWKVRRSLKAYLYQAVRNRALNRVRRKKTKHEAENYLGHTTEGSEQRTAEDVFHADALSRQVEKAISELPERRRMAFLLHRRHGLTYKEVARVMGITPKTVENQIGRALKSLRERLAPLFSRELK